MARSKRRSSPHTIEVHIDEEYQPRIEPEPLHTAALAALAHQGVEPSIELAIAITDDETLHALNLHHRGVDSPTDVLSFPDESRGPFVGAPGLPDYVGDVVISLPRAQVQAAEAGHSLQAELQLLVVHGVLHLLGHDDAAEEQRAEMWDAQTEILRGLGEIHPPV